MATYNGGAVDVFVKRGNKWVVADGLQPSAAFGDALSPLAARAIAGVRGKLAER